MGDMTNANAIEGALSLGLRGHCDEFIRGMD